MLTAAQRELIHRRIDEATRAGLRPARRDARPGHPSRFGWLKTAHTAGREIMPLPTLSDIDEWDLRRPQILKALNG